MVKIDVLVDLFFNGLPWGKRVEKIVACGVSHIETWQGGDAAVLREMQAAAEAGGGGLVSIVMNFATEADVMPIRAENLARFVERVDRYADNALAVGCRQGIVTAGQTIKDRPAADQRRALIAALRQAGEKVAARGFRLSLEPLNTKVDHVGYFLDDPHEGLEIVKEVGLSNVRMLYDIYHMTIMSGNQTVFIEQNIQWIGHFHAAGVPGRHEPFDGEINYLFLLHRIEAVGYAGFIGLEYMPQLAAADSLKKTLEYMQLA